MELKFSLKTWIIVKSTFGADEFLQHFKLWPVNEVQEIPLLTIPNFQELILEMFFDSLAHISNCVISIEILGHNAVFPDVEIKVMIVPDKESQIVDFFVAISSKKVIIA